MKYFPLLPAYDLVAKSMMPTIRSVAKVSGTLRINMLARILTTIITLDRSWGMLWLIIWRRVSMSLV